MKAKITPLNSEPVKERPCIDPAPETEEPKPEKISGTHSTWEKPTKDELKQLNLAMTWKFIRLLLQSLVFFGNLSLMILLRNLDLPLSALVAMALCGSVLLVIYYLEYRAPLQYGERYSPANDIEENSLKAFGFGICGLILLPFFYMGAFFLGTVCFIPAAIMAVLTYRKEFFMLMLFVCRKYTVKDGEVSWRRKERECYRSSTGIKRFSWTSLIYTLDFYDSCERYIPVLVDHYTYCRFKKNGRALLINYRYGDSYMYEMIRIKDPADNGAIKNE